MDLARARQRTRRVQPPQRNPSDFFPFGGGLNQLDSPLSVRSGQCVNAINYEMGINGGYKRISGYLAYDGSPSPEDSSYWLLGYGASTRQRPTLSQVVDGDTSSASGTYLTHTEEGGYGVNYALQNEDFSQATWVTNNLSVIDGDEVWANGIVNNLDRLTESADVTARTHDIETAPGSKTMDVAVGDQVYISTFARYTSGQREGLQLRLDGGSTAFGAPPSVTVDLSRGVVYASSKVVQAGIDFISESVYRVWFLSVAAETAETNVGIAHTMAAETSPNTFETSYIGDGSYTHVTGSIMSIPEDNALLYSFTPANPVDLTAGWGAVNAAVVHDDLVWASGIYSAFNRITDDATFGIHRLISSTTMRIKVGDKIYVEAYVRFTPAQIENLTITINAPSGPWRDLTGNNQVKARYNIQNQTTISSTTEAVESYGVESIDATTMKVWFITKAATSDDSISMSLSLIDIATTDESYSGSNNYLHMTGVRCVLRGSTAPSPDQVLKLGYSSVGATEKNVRSGDLVLANVSGNPFTDDEDVSIGGGVLAQAVGIENENSEPNALLDSTYTSLAESVATTASAPPGSGPVRGVWVYNGTRYCFRDNVGATACIMYESSGSGWTAIALNDVQNFDAGTGVEPAEGSTLDGVTSGASAPIRRVVKTSGTWGVDAVGYFVLGTVAGGPFQNNETLQVSAATVALADGANAVPVLSAGGRYEFRNNNFYGASDLYRMYGVDGVNKGFEYDSNTGFFAQITTGMVNDAPNHLAVHNSYMWYSFAGGSVQNSGVGVPVDWTVVLGAGEIGIGDECTGFNEEVGNSLFIFARNKTFVLQGTSRSNFLLDDFNVNSGSHEWSLQRIGLGCYFDDRGFTTLAQSQRVGSTNFQENTVSELIQPTVKSLADNTSVRCSHLIRTENIYRCYFDDGRIVSIGFDNNQVTGHMPMQYPFVANVACSEEDANGREVLLVGADDGFVYEIETGTSFNGDVVRAFIRTVLYHSKSPGVFKKYMQARLDAQLNGALTLKGQIEYDFHDDEFNLADELDFSTDEAGGYWDDFNWDAFVWDKPTSGIPQQKLEGEGVNAAAYLHTSSSVDESHTLRGVTLQWQPRRIDRRN